MTSSCRLPGTVFDDTANGCGNEASAMPDLGSRCERPGVRPRSAPANRRSSPPAKRIMTTTRRSSMRSRPTGTTPRRRATRATSTPPRHAVYASGKPRPSVDHPGAAGGAHRPRSRWCHSPPVTSTRHCFALLCDRRYHRLAEAAADDRQGDNGAAHSLTRRVESSPIEQRPRSARPRPIRIPRTCGVATGFRRMARS